MPDPLERIANALEHMAQHIHEGGINRLQDSLDALRRDVKQVLRMEARQMAFAQDVLDRITRQTTLIGSIKEWIRNLPTDVATAEEKAAILANLDTNEAELSTAIPANVPPTP